MRAIAVACAGLALLGAPRDSVATKPESVHARIDGRVVGPDGPLRDAEIRLGGGVARSADDGTFSVEPRERAATYRLEARAVGLAPAVLSGIAADAPAIHVGTIELRPAAMLRGTIVSVEGAPISGAVVVATPVGGDESLARTARADATGAFAIDGLALGPHDLVAQADGWADAIHAGIDVGSETSARFRLEPETLLEGIVVDEDGRPIDDARVRVEREEARGSRRDPAATDATGRFAIHGLDGLRRTLEIEAWKPGFLTFRSPLRSIATGHRLELRRGVVVVVRAPASIVALDWEIQRRKGEGWTRDAGSADRRTTEVLAPDRWRITVPAFDVGKLRAHLHGDASASGELSKAPAAPDAALALDAPGVVEGQVVDASGAPLPRVPIEVVIADFRSADAVGDRVRCETDGDGRFRVEGLAGVAIGVRSLAHEWAIAPPPPIGLRRPGSSRATTNPASTVPGRFVAHRAGRIVGRLTFARIPPGEPWPLLVAVLPTDPGGRPETIARIATDPDGRFGVDGLPPGRIAVVAKRSASGSIRSFEDEWPVTLVGRLATIVALAEGESREIALDLPRPQERAVVGSVYAAGSPLSDLSVDLVPVDGAHGASSGTTDADGRFRLRLGAAGKYRLAVRGAGISETRVLDVREDQSRQVNFDVGDAAVRGRLVTPKGSGRPRIALQRERDRERDALWRVAPSETSADAGGRFSFERVAPGRYRVLVFDPDRRLASVASEPFDLAADAVRNLEIDVPLASPLVVSVDDPSTRAGSGRLWITAEEATVPLACLAQAWLFPAVPALAVHGLPPGRYRLRMPAFEDLVVELREGGSATNAVLHPAREPAASRRVGAAYDSRESAIEKSWDWGDEVPWLFEEETLSSSR